MTSLGLDPLPITASPNHTAPYLHSGQKETCSQFQNQWVYIQSDICLKARVNSLTPPPPISLHGHLLSFFCLKCYPILPLEARDWSKPTSMLVHGFHHKSTAFMCLPPRDQVWCVAKPRSRSPEGWPLLPLTYPDGLRLLWASFLLPPSLSFPF